MNAKRLLKFRRLAFIRQGCRCYYCNLPIWESGQDNFTSIYRFGQRKAKYLKSTAEHLVAQQDGGLDSEDNITAACFWCNSRRHYKRPTNAPDPMRYKTWVQAMVARRVWHPAIQLIGEKCTLKSAGYF